MDNRSQTDLVSVIVPVYNVEPYLDECIQSVREQTYQNLEIILVDDGSTDQSGILCDAYSAEDQRIRVIHQQNRGLSAARNKGMDAAGGTYLYFLDSDDKLERHAIECFLSCAVQEEADFVFCEMKQFSAQCKEMEKKIFPDRKKRYRTMKGSAMFRRLHRDGFFNPMVQTYFLRSAYARKFHIRFLEGVIHEDELFSFTLCYHNGLAAHMHEALFAYRIREGSIMSDLDLYQSLGSLYAIYQNALPYCHSGTAAQKDACRIFLIAVSRLIWKRSKKADVSVRRKLEKNDQAWERSIRSEWYFRNVRLYLDQAHPEFSLRLRVVWRMGKRLIRRIFPGTC